jgi:S-methylmethionine-dependent homocysteine/selenocysteine methylase
MSPKYRSALAQYLLSGDLCITDGGVETTLVFKDKLDLPHFAACDLLFQGPEETDKLYDAFAAYAQLSKQYKVNLLLESPTWRASPDWAAKLNYSDDQLKQANIKSVQLIERIRDEYEMEGETHIFVSGCVGPRGDGYVIGALMNAQEAQDYHSHQISILSKDTNSDLIGAMTMTHSEEAIGIARAAKKNDIPVVISFTVETDGKLPSGQSLREAIEQVDEATDSAPLYYMINCAHHSHFKDALAVEEPWTKRIRGIRANASCKSHAELEVMETLDEGDPVEHGKDCRLLQSKLPHINVLGGCCGTDYRHIESICKEFAAKS